jgi:hypothetical protein
MDRGRGGLQQIWQPDLLHWLPPFIVHVAQAGYRQQLGDVGVIGKEDLCAKPHPQDTASQ